MYLCVDCVVCCCYRSVWLTMLLVVMVFRGSLWSMTSALWWWPLLSNTCRFGSSWCGSAESSGESFLPQVRCKPEHTPNIPTAHLDARLKQYLLYTSTSTLNYTYCTYEHTPNTICAAHLNTPNTPTAHLDTRLKQNLLHTLTPTLNYTYCTYEHTPNTICTAHLNTHTHTHTQRPL